MGLSLMVAHLDKFDQIVQVFVRNLPQPFPILILIFSSLVNYTLVPRRSLTLADEREVHVRPW